MPKVAIVHEYLKYFGGAEQVLKVFLELFPEADLFTLFYNQDLLSFFPSLSSQRIKTSSLQKWPSFIREKRIWFPFYPYHIEDFDFSSYDLVISNNSAYSKGVITLPGTLHVCYCHSPTRYFWDWTHRYQIEQGLGKLRKFFLGPILTKMRMWDFQAAQRVDCFLTNSWHVKKRIKKYYRRDSQVIYPPVVSLAEDRNIIPFSERQNYFLLVSRLEAYKKIDLVLSAWQEKDPLLKIVGTGKKEAGWRKSYSQSNIEFLGWVSEKKLNNLYQKAQGLIFPGEEDFGLTMAEALGWGTPVLAFGRGGALEIIKEKQNGVLFREQKVKVFRKALADFKNMKFNSGEIFQKVLSKYHPDIFKKQVQTFLKQRIKET